jgi:hypothetical protein
MVKVLKQCIQYGEDFYTDIGQLNAGYGKYCSVDCFRQWKKDNCNIKLVCEFCGKEYSRIKSMANKSKYCSNECMSEARKINHYCIDCGIKVSRKNTHCLKCHNSITFNKFNEEPK